MTPLPDRASDSGPDAQEPPKDWMDWLFEAGDTITDARRFNADDVRDERLHRIRLIDSAIEALQEARKLL